jgi:hypothetical protein
MFQNSPVPSMRVRLGSMTDVYEAEQYHPKLCCAPPSGRDLAVERLVDGNLVKEGA